MVPNMSQTCLTLYKIIHDGLYSHSDAYKGFLITFRRILSHVGNKCSPSDFVYNFLKKGANTHFPQSGSVDLCI